ncbi:SAF domain-containing protein [Fusibacter bizertensis]
MKKIGIAVLLFICGGLLTYAEVKHINEQEISYTTDVVALKHDLTEGVVIKEQDLQMVSIPNEILSNNYVQDKDEVIGNTLAIALTELTLINKDVLLEKTYFIPSSGNALTSLRLTPEEMLCWEIEVGELVHVVHVSTDGVLTKLGQVSIKGIYDETLSRNFSKKSNVPTFLLIEGNLNVIESIIASRGDGRLEVIKIANK